MVFYFCNHRLEIRVRLHHHEKPFPVDAHATAVDPQHRPDLPLTQPPVPIQHLRQEPAPVPPAALSLDRLARNACLRADGLYDPLRAERNGSGPGKGGPIAGAFD